ncbi:UTP--glucose-1-phosphate uridylyltransferase [Pseudidiomarina tainanensis]|jgi:UTP--glucose-1-phosphate uridylyltransferase|uniref:UTP--glucose-1-phosphate uridylyltransferase n=2 Tax=Pseudidiomarina TaxID=2800384 RepID=A0A1I6GPS3_9GAMM|nr:MULTISPECIES: UTP--glucose-1-phosphate uridylyltransferase GalU [Pseudidiomarina]RZQ56338.1 UTP--glucose-1-phosphate uridylyltransferase [Pseudidiomarina tainanensis]SFR44245.1 UDP-glucose pyrophosphorylase [Pseudidiomarina maritima]
MVKKVVIPVAGLGTRMLPATKAIPKEMLPLVDRPLIQYIVDECAAAGLTDIILVTHSSKSAIENHFDSNYELEDMLEKRAKDQLLAEVRAICPPEVTVMAVRQDVAKGLGHAVLCARPLIEDQPFAVVLPDVLVDAVSCDLNRDNLAEMVANFNASGAAQVMVEKVPAELVNQYGVADIDGVQLAPGEQASIKRLVEKPPIAEAPSDLAVVGRYVFPAALWTLLEKTPPGAGNEIQLTDAMAMLLEQQPVNAYYMKGKSHDCGNKLGYAQAFVEHAARHPAFGADFKDWLRQLS